MDLPVNAPREARDLLSTLALDPSLPLFARELVNVSVRDTDRDEASSFEVEDTSPFSVVVVFSFSVCGLRGAGLRGIDSDIAF